MTPTGGVAPRRGGAVAAIDCGTNSTRLLVCGPDGSPRVRLMRITRLGQGVDRAGVLAPAAIDRTVAVLEEFRGVIDSEGVVRVRATATSAARDAANREEFFAAAEAAVGVRPELLGGAEEGALSFAGATAELDPAAGPWLVADIGGGSTELAVGPLRGGTAERLRPAAVHSLDVGCVRVSERFLASDPPSAGEVAAAGGHIGGLLEDLSATDPAFAVPLSLGPGPRPRVTTLVGLAGTVAALASLDQGLPAYDRDRLHHHVLPRARVEELLASLAADTVAQRMARPGMEAERADVIVGGTLILVTLLRHFALGACLTSETDILDGLVMSLLEGCPA